MQQNTDLIDLLAALNAEQAEYVIVGAYAFAFHGRPRATSDVDVFVGFDPKNRPEGLESVYGIRRPAGRTAYND